MSVVEVAERKARARAIVFLVFAAMSMGVLLVSFGPDGSDFLRGLWAGITTGAALNLAPLARWLKRNNVVARLMDDEATREHRRMSATAGFGAAVVAAIALSFVTEGGAAITPFDVARVIGTAAVVVALVTFAMLELRAARA